MGQKGQSCLFYLKIDAHVITRFLILVPILVFWILKPKCIFGQIRIEKLKVVQFGWKLAHRVSRRCWFVFQHYVSQFPTLNPFLDKFGPKNSKLFILTENWHIWYIEDADSYSDNGQIWAEKVKAVCFAWKLANFWFRRFSRFLCITFDAASLKDLPFVTLMNLLQTNVHFCTSVF